MCTSALLQVVTQIWSEICRRLALVVLDEMLRTATSIARLVEGGSEEESQTQINYLS